ncbi:zinc finger protein 62 homolog [Spodoptera frugiperda]|uniref:Zinc finger protein 62 homolog n=1 Tax=Spodoptera frugiperda TaxID=7108 RepID=A0A9R0CXL7_SPOFR|nr:zinc finger protein 62 homolog [Spodoptera frugiperda]
MTSSLLVQKLMSVKLNTGEFEKIKWLRANNDEKTFKTVSSLRKLLQNPRYRKTCRLCLKPGSKRMFGSNDFDIAVVIKQLLQIQVTEDDNKPQYICKACEVVLRNADQLRQTAEVTQWRLQQELELMTSMESDSEEKEKKPHGGYFVKKGATVVREWTCAKCRQIFDSQKMFTEHGKLPCSRGDKSFVCETCGLELKSMTRLKRHMLIHTGELLYPCIQCPYRARTKYALMVHERAHSGERPLTCPHCPATFLNSSNLASHKRRHLPPAYHCHVCVKSFRFKEALQNHLATQHSTAKPHVCNSCGKAFSTRKMIRRHERRVHNRPKLRSGILPTYLRQQQQEQMT